MCWKKWRVCRKLRSSLENRSLTSLSILSIGNTNVDSFYLKWINQERSKNGSSMQARLIESVVETDGRM